MKLKEMLSCAIFAALLCLCSPLSIPIGPVPISLGLFAVQLCGVVLSWKQSLLSVLLFLLLGLLGLPVFAGGHSGWSAFPGPTGGYLWSYLLAAPLISLLCQNLLPQGRPMLAAAAACLLSLPVCYGCGTLQFSLLAGQRFIDALSVCVVPFLLPDLAKSAAAALVGVPVRNLLHKQLSS